MGMYDEITFEYPLPDKEAQGGLFQTKDMECEMHRYVLEADGILYYHPFHVDKDGYMEYGEFTGKKQRSKFTGVITCCDDIEVHWKKNRVFCEYQFELKNGELVSLIELQFDKDRW